MSINEQTFAPRYVRRPGWSLRPTLQQIARFLGVGAVGYAVNLLAYAFCVHLLAVEYRGAAVLSFVVALATTFVLNRRYTFAATDGSIPAQAWRYAIVNLAGFVTNLLVLQGCVELLAMGKVPAEALAAAAAAPVNYLGGRIWAFTPGGSAPAGA